MDLDLGHGFIPRIGEENYKAVDRCVGPADLFNPDPLDLPWAIIEGAWAEGRPELLNTLRNHGTKLLVDTHGWRYRYGATSEVAKLNTTSWSPGGAVSLLRCSYCKGESRRSGEGCMVPQTFNEAVEASRQNLAAMVNGDAAPTTALWSRRDDVVLANPLGRPILGFAPAAEESARVAAMFVGGEPPEFEEVARWSSDDLGYVVAIEHAQVQRAGSEGLVPMDLRVTTIFRREPDGWRLCVRHADRVTTPG